MAPPAGVDIGLQCGKGSDFQIVQKQRTTGKDLTFDAVVQVKGQRADGTPNFAGTFVQGPAGGKFLYLDIGTLAGQKNTPWTRRLKVHLASITWKQVQQVAGDTKLLLEGRWPGTAKDGGPSCASVKPIQDWAVKRR